MTDNDIKILPFTLLRSSIFQNGGRKTIIGQKSIQSEIKANRIFGRKIKN